MDIVLILNRDAGTLRGLDPGEAADGVSRILRVTGGAVAVRIVSGQDVLAAIRDANRDEAVETIVVGGGDGTISAAAAAAVESGKVLGILPLGTMNFFARSLGIPTELSAAAKALSAGEVAAVDVGRINGRTFVHAVALGLHPAMVAEREKLNYGSRYGKMLGSVRAWGHVVRNHRRFDVAIEIDGRRLVRRTAGLVVSNNLLGRGHGPYADSLDRGLLALYVTAARGWVELVRVTAAAALGRIDENPLIEVHETTTVEIETGPRVARVTIDGELVRMAGPLKIESVPGGLMVLGPASADKA